MSDMEMKNPNAEVMDDDYEDYAEQWTDSDQIHFDLEALTTPEDPYIGTVVTFEEALADFGGDYKELMRNSTLFKVQPQDLKHR